MARVKVDILGISELKWIGMGEFNSDDHYIYYCGQESHRRNGVAIIVNKKVQNAVLGWSLKNDRMIIVHFQGKPFKITVIQSYAPTSNAEEAEIEWFYEDLQNLSEWTHTQKCTFHYKGLECKSRKSRNTWGNRQIWPWNMEWSKAKAYRVLLRERTGHSKHPLPTTQEKTLHTHGYHQMANTKIKLIIFFAAEDGESLYSQQKQDWELSVPQIMNSLLPNSDWNRRKWGKPLDHSGII